jgi:hypothetical protein
MIAMTFSSSHELYAIGNFVAFGAKRGRIEAPRRACSQIFSTFPPFRSTDSGWDQTLVGI